MRAVTLALVLASLLGCENNDRQLEQADWAASENWMVFDHHTHTQFSDGQLPLGDVVALAAEFGCEAMAISDRSDIPAAYSPQYLDALNAARLQHPQILILAGIELEMPSYDRREHVGMVIHPKAENAVVKKLASAIQLVTQNAYKGRRADKTLLDAFSSPGNDRNQIIAVYNHPSRKDSSSSENYDDFWEWSDHVGRKLIFAGAPGHQKDKSNPGNYSSQFLTANRWDPVVSQIGGTWDRLLDEGHEVHAALAGSDFHNRKLDYPPCAFSRTHVAIAEHSYQALLEGLAAGTFWAGHGRVLKSLSVTAELDASFPLAHPGATVMLNREDKLALIRVAIERDANGVSLPLRADAVGTCHDGTPRKIAMLEFGATQNEAEIFLPLNQSGADGKSCYYRFAVSADTGGETLVAHTNAIRFVFP